MRIERVARTRFKVCSSTTERFVLPRLETENFTKLKKKNRAVWKLCFYASLLLLARTRTTRENTPKTSRNKMAVDKAPGKKDKLTDAEKKKQKQANKVRSIFCPLNFTCFFFSSSSHRRPKDLFFSLLDYFCPPERWSHLSDHRHRALRRKRIRERRRRRKRRTTPSGKAAKNPDRKK